MDNSPDFADGSLSSFPMNPEEFGSDDRISFSQLDGKYLLVQDDGTEFEFDSALKRWIPILDDALLEEQQRAYMVAGVDESEPVEAMHRKRKKEYVNGEDEGGRLVNKVPKKSRAPLPPRQNTAIYVTGLPLDATVEEVREVFSRKCGVIAEEIDSGAPRIKLYTDERGEFKGDALIVFFKAPSVDMAIMLLDDTELRFGEGGLSTGKMRVQAADASYKKTTYNNADEEAGSKAGKSQPKSTISMKDREKDKQKIIKKTQKLDARLADWSDDDVPGDVRSSKKFEKVVILKHMFTLAELAEDPAAILEIKEDIREECSRIGEVTNVILYDLEVEGVASVRFATTEAARACVKVMDGRSFAGQKVKAYITDEKVGFRKSREKKDAEEEK